MTQFIFRSDLCACKAPVPIGGTPVVSLQESDISSIDVPAGSDEVELEVDEDAFPRQRYRALSILGSGASGAVYRARDTVLNKVVAVKTLRRITNEQLIQFQSEARATSKLNQRAILKLLDFGPTASGAPYMVLEYFDSLTLDQFIENNAPVSVGIFQHLFSELTAALDHAHSHGILHRDVKPSNILISRTEDGAAPVVKLIDFGVAHIKTLAGDTIKIDGNSLVGTPAYMPPEVVKGKAYDERSEIYSLGCVMFETLTGCPPFQGNSIFETINLQVTAKPPSLYEVGSRPISPELEEIVSTCLEKDPAARFASMSELGDALQNKLTTNAEDSDSRQEFASSSPVPSNKKTESAFNSGRRKALIAVVIVFIGTMGLCLYPVLNSTQTPLRTESKKRNTKANKPDIAFAPEADQLENEADQLAVLEMVPMNNLEAPLTNEPMVVQVVEGDKYFNGNGVAQDYQKALDLYKQAASGGNTTAMNRIADMYLKGIGVTRNANPNSPSWVTEAAHWYHLAAQKGNCRAQCNLGNIYRYGMGTPVDNGEAFKWYHRAAVQNYPPGLALLGAMYRSGLGVKTDYDKALDLLRKAAEHGDSTGQYYLGTMYKQGEGVAIDYEEAVKWFKKSAESGNPKGQNNLGVMYQNGLGVKQDYSTALKWYSKAAEQGEPAGQRHLASLYRTGQGVTRNYQTAMVWYRRAADRGDGPALQRMGEMYRRGLGVRVDYKEAMKWYRLGAERNDSDAEASIGLLYRDGNGVEKNRAEAARWLAQAANHGAKLEEDQLRLIDEFKSGNVR